MKTCDTCIWMETFDPRSDEPSNMGCKKPNWEGYIIDPKVPSCGGDYYTERPEDEM